MASERLVVLNDRANRLLPDAHKRNRCIERLLQLLCEVEIKFDNVGRMVDDVKQQVHFALESRWPRCISHECWELPRMFE